MDLYVIIGLAFVSVFLVSFGVLYLVSTRNSRLKARLAGLQGEDVSQIHGTRLSRTLTEKGLGALKTDSDDISDIRSWLAQAGFFDPQSVFDYYWMRLIGALLIGAGGLIVSVVMRFTTVQMVAATLFGLLLGAFIPKMWVWHRIRKRADEIRRAVPNMLDLMVVCVEAGLSLSAAIQRIAAETRVTSKALSEELRILTQQVLIGKSRAEAFRSLADRTGVDELGSLAVTLAQADKLGTSVAKSLRQLADTMRFKRRQRIEEQSNKVSVKLVFPLVFLIFPELLVVLVGPAAINFWDVMKDMAK